MAGTTSGIVTGAAWIVVLSRRNPCMMAVVLSAAFSKSSFKLLARLSAMIAAYSARARAERLRVPND